MCFSANSLVFTLFGYELNSIIGKTYWFGWFFIYGTRGTPFVMCIDEKKPHPWCENLVSYHGVDLASPFIF